MCRRQTSAIPNAEYPLSGVYFEVERPTEAYSESILEHPIAVLLLWIAFSPGAPAVHEYR